jgi:AraC family transcriptional regulator of adaptative response / DNA-3-methyladenine glycosylase II
MNLDPDACYRAFQTKDARFDGKLFVGVRTTGIFCRPICPAQTPKRENCTFFTIAAAAHEAGFRPCLRCRPELAPHLFTKVGTASTVSRALCLIAEGALDDGTVEKLAARLGVGDRHLRQLFAKHLGTSPVAVAQTRRLLFAKQLLDETSLSMTDIAMAAGFSSIRRFNAVVRKTYQRSPSTLRYRQQTQQGDAANPPEIVLKLPFSPPYNWSALVRFLAARVTPGLESVGASFYRRTISLDGVHGVVEVSPLKEQNYLVATIRFPKVALLAQIVERLRCMFDLDANIADIVTHLQQEPILSSATIALPGLRVPGAWDRFELAVRAILGQQVSVAAATTLAGRLVETYGEPLVIEGMPQKESDLRFVFPRPEVLANADLTALGITRPRAFAISSLATVVAQDRHILTFPNLEDAVQKLSKLPGIGEWTAQYIAMRALREPDAFPASDLGLLRAMENLGHPMRKSELFKVSQAWRPWRAYAAMFLWSSLDLNLNRSYLHDRTFN